MRLHAFRCVHLDIYRINSTRNYQESSIRITLSEDLSLQIQALHKVHSSLWNGRVKERPANDKLAHDFLSDKDFLSMPGICCVPQILVLKDHKQSLFNTKVAQ